MISSPELVPLLLHPALSREPLLSRPVGRTRRMSVEFAARQDCAVELLPSAGDVLSERIEEAVLVAHPLTCPAEVRLVKVVPAADCQ